MNYSWKDVCQFLENQERTLKMEELKSKVKLLENLLDDAMEFAEKEAEDDYDVLRYLKEKMREKSKQLSDELYEHENKF